MEKRIFITMEDQKQVAIEKLRLIYKNTDKIKVKLSYNQLILFIEEAQEIIEANFADVNDTRQVLHHLNDELERLSKYELLSGSKKRKDQKEAGQILNRAQDISHEEIFVFIRKMT